MKEEKIDHKLARSTNPLVTKDQADIERTALRLLQHPEVKLAHADARKLFLVDPLAQTHAGRSTLDLSVDEYVLAAIYDTILHDVSKPRILWSFIPQHRWFGHQISGARYGIDNPDNIYRMVVLDSAGSYAIHARPAGTSPVDLSFQLYTDNRFSAVLPGEPPPSAQIAGNPEKKATTLDMPLGGLFGKDIQFAAEGRFTITLSPEPAKGRANHIQTSGDDPLLLIRESLSDWAAQTPHWLEIRRLDQGSARAAQTELELAARAVERMNSEIPFWLRFNNVIVAAKKPNAIPTPRARGTGWGFSAIGNLQLASDEALLTTIHPQGARYTGMTVFDPWCITREHIHRSGSLNNDQARANADGSYTYVIAARDPGIANWLDTDGLESGGVNIRWQAFPQQPPTADGLLREVKLVKMSDLEKVLPRDTPRMTPAQRTAELAARTRAYGRRLAKSLDPEYYRKANST